MTSTITPHHTKAAVLAAKRDLLIVAARQYAHGTADLSDLEEAAVEFTAALEEKAMENLRGGR